MYCLPHHHQQKQQQPSLYTAKKETLEGGKGKIIKVITEYRLPEITMRSRKVRQPHHSLTLTNSNTLHSVRSLQGILK